MSTTVITTPTALTAPLAGTPNIYDLDEDLAVLLSAERVFAATGLQDGAAVSIAVADGTGPLTERAFDGKSSTNWGFPTMAEGATPNGQRAFDFDGNQQFHAFDNSATPSAMTLVYVFDLASGSQGSVSRLYSGDSSVVLNPTTETNLIVNFGNASGQTIPTGWQVFVVSVPASGNGLLYIEGSGVFSWNVGNSRSQQHRIGGNSSTGAPGGAGLVGQVAEFRKYNRNLNNSEIVALVARLKAIYGIA